MDPCWSYHLCASTEIKTHPTKEHFSKPSTVQLWWTLCPLQLQVSALNWQKEKPDGAPTASRFNVLGTGKFFCLAQLLQSGYPSYRSPSVSSEQAGHSLTSLINNVFLSTELLLTVACENPRRSKRLTPAASLAPTITSQSKSLGSFWCLMWTFTEVPDLYLHNLMQIHCCRMIGRLDGYMIKEVSKCSQ